VPRPLGYLGRWHSSVEPQAHSCMA
jgi:hypothetical protein